MTERRATVAVLGGGIAGLAAAYFLGNYGYRPIVFEGSSAVGGLGSAIDHDGARLDRFYHVLLNTDADLLDLIAELDLADRLTWSSTGMGFYLGGRLYSLNTPLDLLRFSA